MYIIIAPCNIILTLNSSCAIVSVGRSISRELSARYMYYSSIQVGFGNKRAVFPRDENCKITYCIIRKQTIIPDRNCVMCVQISCPNDINYKVNTGRAIKSIVRQTYIVYLRNDRNEITLNSFWAQFIPSLNYNFSLPSPERIFTMFFFFFFFFFFGLKFYHIILNWYQLRSNWRTKDEWKFKLRSLYFYN